MDWIWRSAKLNCWHVPYLSANVLTLFHCLFISKVVGPVPMMVRTRQYYETTTEHRNWQKTRGKQDELVTGVSLPCLASHDLRTAWSAVTKQHRKHFKSFFVYPYDHGFRRILLRTCEYSLEEIICQLPSLPNIKSINEIKAQYLA